MVIRRSLQNQASGLSTYGLYSPMVPAPRPIAPGRPPLYLVPSPAPEVPIPRTSPLWIPIGILLGILLGPGDTRRSPVSDAPPPEETAAEPVDVERLRQEYFEELSRLSRKLFNGEVDDWEASFIRARIGVLTMLLEALPTGASKSTSTPARPVIVNSTDGAPEAGDPISPITTEEEVIRRRLKSADLNEQWKAWQELLQLNPEAARHITEVDMGPQRSFVPGRSGVARHVLTDYEVSQGVADFIFAHDDDCPYDDPHLDNPWHDTIVDLRTVHPAHSLHEYLASTISQIRHPLSPPYPKYFRFHEIDRRSYRTDYVTRLQAILAEMGTADPQDVLRRFATLSVRNDRDQNIFILQLLSGKRVIYDGHHHIAALVQVVREKGLDPDLWLYRVPVKLFTVPNDIPIPEHLILRFMAPAHELTIDELLPPPNPQNSLTL